jgi:VWFA-related protein
VLNAKHRILRCVGIFCGVLLFFCGSSLFPESKEKKEDDSKSQTTFKVPVNVVVVNATVTDKSGNPVTDLTENDFKVYEDGKPQGIQTFALDTYGPPELVETKAPVIPSKVPATPPKRTATDNTASRPRMISILIDDVTMESAADFPRMIEAVKGFVEKDMGPADQVALLSASGRVQFPFSNDKRALLEGLDAALRKLNFNTVGRSPCPKLTDLEAWRIADSMRVFQDTHYQAALQETIQCLGMDDSLPSAQQSAELQLRMAASSQSQVTEYQTRNLLSIFRQHLRALRHFEGAKTIVLFSDGFLSEKGSAEGYQLQEIIDLALRAGIVLNSVNIRGLPVTLDAQEQDDLNAQESPLNQMAYETGGTFVHNRNNLYKGLQSIARRQSYYYVLTYGMPTHKADGVYHNIKLELTRPGLQLSYRKGYFTAKEQLSYENRRKEDIIDALNAPGNMNEIPMTLAYNYSQEDDSTYSVSFVTNVNIRKMQFLDEESRRKNAISLILAAFDENDKFINGLDKSVEFQLLEESYSALRNQGITSRVELKLPPGHYKIKAVVREGNQGKMGSITKSMEIP